MRTTSIGPSAPFIVGGAVKIVYDLTLSYLFRRVKPPEEALGRAEKALWAPCAQLLDTMAVL